MEPRIQYAKTSDGVSIGCYEVGEGPTIVIPANVFFGHLRIRVPPEFHFDGYGLGRHHRIVRYDARGTGLSDRNSLDFSLQARLTDLDGVVQRLGLERFALLGRGHGAAAAVAYAVKHADCVSHLLIWGPVLSEPGWWSDWATRFESLLEFAGDDWEGVTLTMANVSTAFHDADLARRLARRYRESMTPKAFTAFFESVRRQGVDITQLLPGLKCPTLVIWSGTIDQREGRSRAVSQRIAAAIPGARLVVTQGPPPSGWGENETRIAEEFLGIEPEGAPERLPSGTAVILFADIADSTALTERLGDAAFRAKARELGASLRAVIRECAGTPVEGPTLGDGVLAVFTSAREAIEAARRCGNAGDDAGLPLHLGLHAGDVMREKDPDGRDNVYGGAVNIASRISGLSAPGEVLVSDTVRGLARTSASVTFEDRGEQALKGVGEAVRVWAAKEGK